MISNERRRELRQMAKQKDIVMFKCKQMSGDAYSRVFAESRADKTNYRNLDEPFGFKDGGELKQYLYNRFYNEIKELLDKNLIPSIDRIDSSKGYTKDNIRIIDFKRNTLLGVEKRKKKVQMTTPNGKILIFESVTKCADYLGYKPTETSRISGWCKGKSAYIKPKGYEFEYTDSIR